MFRKNARSANLIINELINGQLMVINVQKNARSANLKTTFTFNRTQKSGTDTNFSYEKKRRFRFVF